MNIQQQVANTTAAITGGGIAGFVLAAEPYMKLAMFVIGALAGITTIIANWAKIREWWKNTRP